MRRLKEEMKTHITEEKAEKLLRELISTPSPSGREGEIAEIIAEELEARGLETERMRVPGCGGFNLLCRIGDGGETLILNSHMDTVPPHDMEHPYEARIEDGVLYGRGACDAKGGLTAMILAAEELADVEAENMLLLTFVVDEENQGMGTITLLLRGVRGDAAIVCEPTDLKLCTAQYGYVEVRLRTHGRSAHGATPERGVNAVEDMMRVLEHLRHLPPLSGEERPALNIGIIRGGEDSWIVPHLCEADILISTPPELSTSRVLEELRRHLSKLGDIALELEVLESDEGYRLSRREPIVRLMERNIREVLGYVEYSAARSWTDANTLFNYAGIPSVIYGPGELHHAHSGEERVRIRDVTLCARVLASACGEFLRRGLSHNLLI